MERNQTVGRLGGVLNFFKDKRVLVTGHTGFKGSWLAEVLLFCGAKVSGLSLRPHTNPNLFTLLRQQGRLNNFFGDIRHSETIKKIFSETKPEIVFHLAAQAIVRESYDDPLYTIETNVLGTANVLEAARQTGSVKSAIIVTSDKVYKNMEWERSYVEDDILGGHDPYSASKSAADIIAASFSHSFFHKDDFGRLHGTLVAQARAGNIIGGGDWGKDRLITDIVRACYEKQGRVAIRNPRSIRPWQYVLEPLYGYLLLAKELYGGNIDAVGPWNFGPGEENFMSVEEITQKAFAFLGRGESEVVPDNSKREAGILKLDPSKARRILNWHSKLNVDEALRLTLAWYENYHQKLSDHLDFTHKQIEQYLEN